MQIQNHYNSYYGAGQHGAAHTHHITKCLFEEEHRRQEQQTAAGIKANTLTRDEGERNQEDKVYEYGTGTKGSLESSGPRQSVFRRFWDSMGDSEENAKTGDTVRMSGAKESLSSIRKFDGNVVSAAASALRHALSGYVIHKWEQAREKIRTGVSTSLKRFGKRGDTFTALSDPKSSFSGERGDRGRGSEKSVQGTRRGKTDILTASLPENHLLDSYSRTGEYCHLEDHLNYGKNKVMKNQENTEKDY